ncbi:MAG: hypothetical protein V4534_04120 [Myxococcota bacterium]
MKRLQVLIERFQNLNDDDKKKALLAAGLAILLIVGLVLWGAISSLNSRHATIKKLELETKQIDALSTQYERIQSLQQARQAQIRANKIALFTLIQNVATRLDLTVNDLNERKEPMNNSDLTQVSVVVTLKQLSVDRLNAFLENVEDTTEGGLVKVTRLQVKTRFDQPDLLDVQMTVTTWKAS